MEDILAWLADEIDDMQAPDPRRDRARAIKTALAGGTSRREAAAAHGVSLSTVGRIARGELWADVEIPAPAA